MDLVSECLVSHLPRVSEQMRLRVWQMMCVVDPGSDKERWDQKGLAVLAGWQG